MLAKLEIEQILITLLYSTTLCTLQDAQDVTSCLLANTLI